MTENLTQVRTRFLHPSSHPLRQALEYSLSSTSKTACTYTSHCRTSAS